jgi:hypothetical protein
MNTQSSKPKIFETGPPPPPQRRWKVIWVAFPPNIALRSRYSYCSRQLYMTVHTSALIVKCLVLH